MYFEILRSSRGLYYWHIKAGNGEILANSEEYSAKQSCLKAIGMVQRGAASAQIYDRT